jgi:RHS repeat-associated protein
MSWTAQSAARWPGSPLSADPTGVASSIMRAASAGDGSVLSGRARCTCGAGSRGGPPARPSATATTWAVTDPGDRAGAGTSAAGAGSGAGAGAESAPGVGGRAAWLTTNARGEAPDLDPWGTSTTGAGSAATATAPPLADGLSLGHRGELDVDGLTWLRARAYDPTTHSFLSPDRLPGVPGTPWGHNPYHYAANDPVGHADPSACAPSPTPSWPTSATPGTTTPSSATRATSSPGPWSWPAPP